MASNFINLPDATQLIRGTTNIYQYSEDAANFLAPFTCVMAAIVGNKYAVRTWSPEVVDYVLRCGFKLYKTINVRFEDISEMQIQKICLGKTNFTVDINYKYDGFFSKRILEDSLEKMLRPNEDWIIITTQESAFSVFLRDGLYHLYDPLPTNDVGLVEVNDVEDKKGTASFGRFTDLDSLVTRIVYNKNKRDEKEKLKYSRFAVSTCTVTYLQPKPEPHKTGQKYKEEELQVVDYAEDISQHEVHPEKHRRIDDKERPKNKVG